MNTAPTNPFRTLALTALSLTLILTARAGTRLVYEKEGAVWMLEASAGEPKELVKGGRPAIRSDGKAVAYLRGKKKLGDASVPVSLYIMDLNTRKEKQLATDTFVEGPLWSPDNKKLAFIRYSEPEAGTKLCVVDADGGKLQLVPLKSATTLGSLWSLEWLPDGSGLGFHDMSHYWHVATDGKILQKMPVAEFAGKKNPDGRERDSFSSADTITACPSDDRLLAFTEDVSGSEIFTEALQGDPISALLIGEIGSASIPRLLTDKTITVMDVCWAPDGKSLYFAGYRDKHAKEEFPFRIYRIGSEGQELTEIDHGQNPSVADEKAPSP